MEELRSTEVLDREILEDARKKAYRILKTADETIAAQNRDWEKKISASVDSIRKIYSERIKKSEGEILARLPLDKRRLRSQRDEGFLQKAMRDFLRGLERKELLDIVKSELYERLKTCSVGAGSVLTGSVSTGSVEGEKPECIYSGLSQEEAGGILSDVLAAFTPAPGNVTMKEGANRSEFPSIVINTRGIKITASVENAAGALVKDKRAELAAALLGEGVLND